MENSGNTPPEEEKQISFLQLLKSTMSAFIGVQSNANRERDFKYGKISHFIGIGLLFALVFVLTLVALVQLVLRLNCLPDPDDEFVHVIADLAVHADGVAQVAVAALVERSEQPTTLVEFKLEPMGDGTVLVVTESGFDALPAEHRDMAFRRNSEGWTGQMRNIETHVTKSS